MAEPAAWPPLVTGRPLPRLMLVTDADQPDPITPLLLALRSVDPADVLVQVRLKTWTSGARRAAAARLTGTGAPLVVNSDIALAQSLGAGVHLPSQSASVAETRAALRDGAWVGRSCHDEASLAQAEAEGASYVTLGPVGAVPHKGCGRGVAWLVDTARRTPLPVFALGGVALADVPVLLAGGVHGVALMRAVPASASPADTLRDVIALTR